MKQGSYNSICSIPTGETDEVSSHATPFLQPSHEQSVPVCKHVRYTSADVWWQPHQMASSGLAINATLQAHQYENLAQQYQTVDVTQQNQQVIKENRVLYLELILVSQRRINLPITL